MNQQTTTKNKDFSKFGKAFQENLVRIMFEDKSFARQILEVLEISFFELKYLQVFVGKMELYFKKYDVFPTIAAMTSIIKSEIEEDDSVKKQIKDFFSKIISESDPLDDEEYIKETSLEFCKKKKLQEALMKSAKLVEGSKFNDIKRLIEDALKLGSDNNFGHDFKLDFEERYKSITRNPISTGLPEIDNITQGGFGKGELCIVVAPTGGSKSHCLCYLGAQALKQGKSVVHYSFELSEAIVAKRYDSCISQIPMDDLPNMKEEVFQDIIKIPGKLIVKFYPARSASIQTLKNHISKLVSSGFKPDMIIVDYADLLRATVSRDEKYLEREEIYEELRAFAAEAETSMISASQTNRSGMNAEIISLESIADAFAKCFPADFIMTLSRTAEDKKSNRGRFFIAKNRNGVDGIIFNCKVDTSTSTFEILPEKITEQLLKSEAAQKMKDIYEEFKNEIRKKNDIYLK